MWHKADFSLSKTPSLHTTALLVLVWVTPCLYNTAALLVLVWVT